MRDLTCSRCRSRVRAASLIAEPTRDTYSGCLMCGKPDEVGELPAGLSHMHASSHMVAYAPVAHMSKESLCEAARVLFSGEIPLPYVAAWVSLPDAAGVWHRIYIRGEPLATAPLNSADAGIGL